MGGRRFVESEEEREIAQHAVAAVQHRGERPLLPIDHVADEPDLEEAAPGGPGGAVAVRRLHGEEGSDLVEGELPGCLFGERAAESWGGERPDHRLPRTVLREHESEPRRDGVVAGAGEVQSRSRDGPGEGAVELLEQVAGVEGGVLDRVRRRREGLHDGAQTHRLAALAEHRVDAADPGGTDEHRVELDVPAPGLLGEVGAAGDDLRLSVAAVDDDRLGVQSREVEERGRGGTRVPISGVLHDGAALRSPVDGGVQDIDVPAAQGAAAELIRGGGAGEKRALRRTGSDPGEGVRGEERADR